MVFPVEVARFRRSQIRRYDVEGRDVGVGYDLPSMTEPIAVTAYIYPVPPARDSGEPVSLTELFEPCKREITTRHAPARQVTQGDVSLPPGQTRCPGRMAVFNYRGRFHRTQSERLTSYLYVFGPIDDTWVVKYRITHPADADASERIDEFMQGLDWSSIVDR